MTALVGCAPTDDASGASAAIVLTTPQVFLTPTYTVNAGEPHAVFVTGGTLPDTFVVGYNRVERGHSLLAWSYLAAGDTTFTNCDALTSCGTGGGPLTPPIGVTTFAGDPYLVTDRLGHLVIMNMANGIGAPNRYVTASLSFDGGRTVANTVIVNEDDCNDGAEDQPAAAFDTTVNPPQLWAAWRHKGKGGTYGVCYRKGHLDFASQTVAWDTTAAIPVSVTRTDPTFGVGGLLIQAGDGGATIVSSGSDNILGGPFGPACPGTRTLGGNAWYSTTTLDDGVHWEPSVLITATSTFDVCVGRNVLRAALRSFAFVRDDAGVYYVAVNDAPAGITIYQSENQGLTWRRPVRVAPPVGTTSLFFPTLASAAGGHVAVSFYATGPADDTAAVFVGATHDARELGAWEPAVRVSTFMPILPGRSARFGDYMGLAAVRMPTCTSPDPVGNGMPPLAAASYYAPAWTDISRVTMLDQGEISMSVVGRVPPP